VASLDHLSAGRAVLGVGTGTPRGPEFTAFGEEPDLRVRGDMLDEGLAVVRAAWSGGEVHHRGAHYRVDGAAFLPRPLQTPLPIWAATESVRGRAVRRAAGLDGVVPIGLEPDQVAELVEGITAARTGVGGRYDVVTAGTDGPERWLGSGLTWWLRLLAWDAPIAEALAEVAAGPH
jgi:alkanesulfonate monooxygenase SsuD/methylene tetrahydromethanopterin reductase-like flavin-dependent oxidoreductase (luciferase family)